MIKESFSERLKKAWSSNNSLLCVGLDADLNKLPDSIKRSDTPVFDFNKAIVDATAQYVCAFKPQIAFYAASGRELELELTIAYIRETYPALLVILDSKRGDIGNTAEQYAKEAFDRYQADAVTVNPYMGGDTLIPFLNYQDKGTIILCRTSNPGASEFQDLLVGEQKLYQYLASRAVTSWNTNKNIALVVGATVPNELKEIRAIVGDEIPLLVPGIGAQGGSIKEVVNNGKTQDGLGLLINSSRAIIYASDGEDFADEAGRVARETMEEVNSYR